MFLVPVQQDHPFSLCLFSRIARSTASFCQTKADELCCVQSSSAMSMTDIEMLHSFKRSALAVA